MDQTAYTSEVQPCAGGEAKSVDREKRSGWMSKWQCDINLSASIESRLDIELTAK
jgi:hypothetical protein